MELWRQADTLHTRWKVLTGRGGQARVPGSSGNVPPTGREFREGFLEDVARHLGFGGLAGVCEKVGGNCFRQRNSMCKGSEGGEYSPSGELLAVCVGRSLRSGRARRSAEVTRGVEVPGAMCVGLDLALHRMVAGETVSSQGGCSFRERETSAVALQDIGLLVSRC